MRLTFPVNEIYSFENLNNYNSPGLKPINNIFSFENCSGKAKIIWNLNLFLQKQKNFLGRFFGAASWGRFLKKF